jgi:hypothetical protein
MHQLMLSFTMSAGERSWSILVRLKQEVTHCLDYYGRLCSRVRLTRRKTPDNR